MTPRELADRLNESEDFDLPENREWGPYHNWVYLILDGVGELQINAWDLGQKGCGKLPIQIIVDTDDDDSIAVTERHVKLLTALRKALRKIAKEQ